MFERKERQFQSRRVVCYRGQRDNTRVKEYRVTKERELECMRVVSYRGWRDNPRIGELCVTEGGETIPE